MLALTSTIALLLPAIAAEIDRRATPTEIALASRLARAQRGVLATAVAAALVVAMAAYVQGMLTETAMWIALLGLPAASARMMITATENRDAAMRLRLELGRATERNAELVEARSDALAARDAQRVFLGRTSHELRTPLNAILGFAELLEAEDLSGDAHLRLGQVRRAGEHLLEVVEDLLDLQQIEAGRVPLRSEVVPLRSIVVGATEQVAAVAAEVDGRVAIVRGDWEALTVETDGRRVEQILVNLLANGLRHAGGTVEIAVENQSSSITLHVSDTGPGMCSETLDRIFKPFERCGVEYSSTPGAGLGLGIARSLAEALGGRLTAQSIERVGSRFSLTLPTAPRNEAPIRSPFEGERDLVGSAI